MNVSQLMAIGGLIISALGSFILILPYLRSEKEIGELSGTYWGRNPHMSKVMKLDRERGRYGFGLLFLGFVFQILAQLL